MFAQTQSGITLYFLNKESDCESMPRRFEGCGPIHESTGVLCYVGRRFQSRTLNKLSDGKTSREPSELYEVRIIDNDFNTYQQVIDVSMLALGISEDEAFAIAWEVDHSGYCVVAHGAYEQAEAVAATIRTIGIEVQVNLVEAPAN
jgi:ATP-dependent Clp protease adapter protein ClpS